MLLDDAVGYGKSQARSTLLTLFRRGLGSEKRIVDALNMFRSDARTGVRHSYAYHVPIAAGHLQFAAAGHRLFGIEEQVQEDLLQSSGISLDRRNSRGQIRLDLNLGNLELMLQKRERVGDDLVNIDVGEFSAAGARKVQQVTDNFRSPEGLPRNLLQQSRFLRITLQLLGEHLR